VRALLKDKWERLKEFLQSSHPNYPIFSGSLLVQMDRIERELENELDAVLAEMVHAYYENEFVRAVYAYRINAEFNLFMVTDDDSVDDISLSLATTHVNLSRKYPDFFHDFSYDDASSFMPENIPRQFNLIEKKLR
jgi:hypothetical protein